MAFILAAFLSFSLSSAETKDPEIKLTLRDGTFVVGTSKLETISLVTPYGKLEIPVKNVSAISVGIATDKSQQEKVISLVKQVQSQEEEARKTAYQEITKLPIGCVRLLADFLQSDKYQPAEFTDYTPDGALNELMAAHNLTPDFSDTDVVSIDFNDTISGVFGFTKLDLTTAYGALSIPKEKIKKIEITNAVVGEGTEKVFVLLASKHISSNTDGGWLKTGIMVKPGQYVSINSTGVITFASLSGAQYKPSGEVVGSTSNYPSTSSYPKYGQVVFKVGESGVTTKAADKFSGAMTQSGMLYISIYETVYNASNSGSYTVKVKFK